MLKFARMTLSRFRIVASAAAGLALVGGTLLLSTQSNAATPSATPSPSASATAAIPGKFSIALIGPDGNLDYLTDKVLNINRVLEVTQNTFEIQKAAHR